MSDIKIWFDKNKDKLVLILIIIGLSLLLLLSLKSCGNLKKDLNISNINIKALNDTVRITKNKAGEIESSKSILILEKNQLEEYNNDLYKELQKEKGKVSELNKYILGFKQKPNDTIIIINTLKMYPNNVFGLVWDYDTIYNKDNTRKISGESRFKFKDSVISPGKTYISKDEIQFSLITGLKEKDGNIEIFVRSTYPGFYVSKIDGAIIDPKKHPVLKNLNKTKRWGVGPYIGVGVGSNLKVIPQIGLGIQYSIIKF